MMEAKEERNLQFTLVEVTWAMTMEATCDFSVVEATVDHDETQRQQVEDRELKFSKI